jgi:hypothetical protein
MIKKFNQYINESLEKPSKEIWDDMTDMEKHIWYYNNDKNYKDTINKIMEEMKDKKPKKLPRDI